MHVLLDECMPRRLKTELPGHDVRTVPEMGWAGIVNGELLRLAAPHFDVFLTVDKGIAFQQNLRGASLALMTLRVRSNRFKDLSPLIPEVRRRLAEIRPGQKVRIG